MIGRERDFEVLGNAFADAKRNRAPAIARIAGESGIGKTFLLSELARDLKSRGWFVVETACHAIQQHTPRLVANRVATSAVEQLGSDASRYTGGLENGLAGFDAGIARAIGTPAPAHPIDADGYAFTLLRLFEGIAVDHDIAILCDDAQWMDAESARALLGLPQKVSTGCISLAVAERSEDTSVLQWFPSTEVGLKPLGLQESLRFIASEIPDLDPQSAEMLAHHAAGRPLELVTLCEAYRTGDKADLERSLRARIAAHLSGLEADVREFVQMCALIGDPIEQRILLNLYPDAGKLEDLIARSGRYVEPVDGDLKFRHAMLAQSVIQSVPVQIPFHRRIIDALQALDELQLSDYERIARHAAACGDVSLQIRTYSELAAEAYRRQLWSAVIRASGSVLALHPITDQHDPRFLQQYALALRAFDREPEVADLLLRELPKLAASASEVVGDLVATLVSVLGALDREDQALAVYGRYQPRLRYEAQVARASVGAMFGAMFTNNETLFNEADATFSALEGGIEDHLHARREYTRAAFLSMKGNYPEVKRAMASALSFSTPSEPHFIDLMLFGAMMYDFREIGCESLATRLPVLAQRFRFTSAGNSYGKLCNAWCEFFIGEWEAALAAVKETYAEGMPLMLAAPLLAIPAAMSALSGCDNQFISETERVVRAVAEGRYRQSATQLLPWWLITHRDAPLERYARIVASDLAVKPPSVAAIGYVPAGFALWAATTKDIELLNTFAACEQSSDRAPWATANWKLARGLALDALANPDAAAMLSSCSEDFKRLSAPFMAGYAAHKAHRADTAEQSMLARLGIIKAPSQGRKARAAGDVSLTPREWDVARLVGKGATNRQTAEGLFVSERTVEVHLGNIFGKLGVSSRAQLVRWLYENESAS